jgi:hypothetical protein
MWFRQVVKCNLCKTKTRKKDTWQLHMNTSEGHHAVTVCNDCADALREMKENIGTWLER